MFIPLLLLLAFLAHGQHMSLGQIDKEINSIINFDAGAIIEYIKDNADKLAMYEESEAEAKAESKDKLEQWYRFNLSDYHRIVDKVMIGNQVCYYKSPGNEGCRISGIWASHGHLKFRGHPMRDEFLATIRGHLRRDEL